MSRTLIGHLPPGSVLLAYRLHENTAATSIHTRSSSGCAPVLAIGGVVSVPMNTLVVSCMCCTYCMAITLQHRHGRRQIVAENDLHASAVLPDASGEIGAAEGVGRAAPHWRTL